MTWEDVFNIICIIAVCFLGTSMVEKWFFKDNGSKKKEQTMDYEQKYNELVNAVKILKETNSSDEGIQNWVNENVPELAESEDEKIRKRIIATINLYYGEPLEDEAKEMIAWLEKQDKQILANSAKTCKDEQKLSNLESIGEKWSEEDEITRKTFTNIVNMFYEGCIGKAERNLLLNWLKYLKERVQPKQEWSEEDEKEWKSIVSVLTRMHFLDELNFLRHKLNR